MFKRKVHPGVVLKDELEELGITPTEFARQIDVPANRVSQIIAGKRSITGDTALRFGHWFGTDPQFWISLQAQFDLAAAEEATGETIRHLPTKETLPPQHEQPRLVREPGRAGGLTHLAIGFSPRRPRPADRTSSEARC